MASAPDKRLLTATEFLEIDFGPDIKAELDNGIIRVIRMMAGGTARHSWIQINLGGMLWLGLKGSNCHAFGPDMAVIVNEYSVRYPDLSVYCGKDAVGFDDARAFRDPVLVVEILSPSTAMLDQGAKLEEYRSILSIESILLIDPKTESVRLLSRTGPQSWIDSVHNTGQDIHIPHLNIALPLAEIFAR